MSSQPTGDQPNSAFDLFDRWMSNREQPAQDSSDAVGTPGDVVITDTKASREAARKLLEAAARAEQDAAPAPHVVPERPAPLPGPGAYVRPQPTLQVAPEPPPYVAPEPEPIAEVTPEPATYVAPEPEPIAEVTPEPATYVAPEPEPIAEVTPEPAAYVAPEPEPIAEVTPEPAPTAPTGGKRRAAVPTDWTPEAPVVEAPVLDAPDLAPAPAPTGGKRRAAVPTDWTPETPVADVHAPSHAAVATEPAAEPAAAYATVLELPVGDVPTGDPAAAGLPVIEAPAIEALAIETPVIETPAIEAPAVAETAPETPVAETEDDDEQPLLQHHVDPVMAARAAGHRFELPPIPASELEPVPAPVAYDVYEEPVVEPEPVVEAVEPEQPAKRGRLRRKARAVETPVALSESAKDRARKKRNNEILVRVRKFLTAIMLSALAGAGTTGYFLYRGDEWALRPTASLAALTVFLMAAMITAPNEV